ncbi:hypothetical protein CIPAW_10G038600 [Carya illinoinensis]|uniref:Methyltransferase type 11 domain-containing protein n=1 Tax=Carya illinoinensis TaxID=32201 RepID=A0A8T1P9V9_CARIL|nr:hypothetical protein CIPAW_10G038600 [Carya illinoinensis]
MAELLIKQAELYNEARPSYRPELFEFIASKTPCQELAWDVGTGSGQAARSFNTSSKQLALEPRLPNVRYQHAPPTTSAAKLECNIAPQSSIDIVTVATFLHWFDLPRFYQQVKWVLKKPHGVMAAWSYTMPEVNDKVDVVFQHFYDNVAGPYWEPARKLWDDKSWSAYKTARENVMELLSNDMIEDYKNVVKFPIYLRIGRVGKKLVE